MTTAAMRMAATVYHLRLLRRMEARRACGLAGPEMMAVEREAEVGGLMGGQLENDDGEAELEDELHGDERAEGVVVALLKGGEGAGDKGDGDEAGGSGPAARENGIGDGLVYAQSAQGTLEEIRGGGWCGSGGRFRRKGHA